MLAGGILWPAVDLRPHPPHGIMRWLWLSNINGQAMKGVKGTVLSALHIAMILISAGLITLVLLQSKGSSLSGIFGSDSTVYRSKRGVEKTLFNATVATAVVFVLMALLVVIAT